MSQPLPAGGELYKRITQEGALRVKTGYGVAMPPESQPKTELIIALDYPNAAPARALIGKLRDRPLIYKVGSELFVSAGPDFVRELVESGKKVFLDLKFHDIPNTMAKAAAAACELGVAMFTVHLAAGPTALKAVSQAVPVGGPLILGVSVLTSFSDEEWGELGKRLTGSSSSAGDSVERLVESAPAWGATGLVCSARELEMVGRKAPSLYTVVPGIRPKGFSDKDDQARVMSPEDAHRLGARSIVMGRPVTGSERPEKVVDETLKELGH